jgi:hypothetical protein
MADGDRVIPVAAEVDGLTVEPVRAAMGRVGGNSRRSFKG